MGAVLVLVSAAQSRNGAPQAEDRLRVTCDGRLASDGAPESRIIADGVIDFASMRVHGFGLGGQAILSVTETVIVFGSPLGGDGAAMTSVEGAIDRTTGATRIVVRAAGDPARPRMAMTLTCRLAPIVS